MGIYFHRHGSKNVTCEDFCAHMCGAGWTLVRKGLGFHRSSWACWSGCYSTCRSITKVPAVFGGIVLHNLVTRCLPTAWDSAWQENHCSLAKSLHGISVLPFSPTSSFLGAWHPLLVQLVARTSLCWRSLQFIYILLLMLSTYIMRFSICVSDRSNYTCIILFYLISPFLYPVHLIVLCCLWNPRNRAQINSLVYVAVGLFCSFCFHCY